jgi:hypothetical protein
MSSQIRAGDIIAFQGAGVLSGLIEAFSAGPSHIGIIRQSWHPNAITILMSESTIDGARNGVQTNPLADRLANYDGAAFWLPLSEEVHEAIDWFKFYQFIGGAEDFVKYATNDLFDFILRDLPIAGVRLWQQEDRARMVCSGFVTAALEAAGVLRGINWSKVSPQDLVEMKLYRGDAVQLVGAPATLSQFNTL